MKSVDDTVNSPVELQVQEREDFCVCSTLQAVFRKHGLPISQEEIAQNLTRGRKEGFVVHDSRIRNFMSRHGFSYIHFEAYGTPFNEPYEVLREMSENSGILGIDTHAYLVKNFHDPVLKLIDPKNGKEVEIMYQDLLRRMGFNGFFGLIKHIS